MKNVCKFLIILLFAGFALSAHAQSTCPGGSLQVNQAFSEISKCGTTAAARTSIVAAKSGANSDITSLTGLTTPLSAAQGGTGNVNSSTITVAGPFSTTGAYSVNLTATGATNVTLPASGTLFSNTVASALVNGSTAVTQTVGDNSTDVATDAFVLANAGSGPSLPLSVSNGGTGHNNTGSSGIIMPSGSEIYAQAGSGGYQFIWGTSNYFTVNGSGTLSIAENSSNAIINAPIQFPSQSDYIATSSQIGGKAYVYVRNTASGSFNVNNPDAFIEFTGTSGTTTATLANPNSWGTVASTSNSTGNVAVTYDIWNNSSVSVTIATSGSGFIGPSGTCGAAGGTSFTLAAGATCSLIDDGTHYVSIRN